MSIDLFPSTASPVWNAWWVAPAEKPALNAVAAYRLPFEAAAGETFRVHVSADQRYDLYLNGEWIGFGPSRGDLNQWFYETYDLKPNPGANVLVARVWSFDVGTRKAPYAQLTVAHGFILASKNAQLNTGVGPWEARFLPGFTPTDNFPPAAYAGGQLVVDGRLVPWGYERGAGECWAPAVKESQGHSARSPLGWGEERRQVLVPTTLPPQMRAERRAGCVRHAQEGLLTPAEPVRQASHREPLAADWQRFIDGEGALVIPANSRQTVILDLENYFCAFPELELSGGEGAVSGVRWCEALQLSADEIVKENRDEIYGKHFQGTQDQFIADGGERRVFSTLWWRCGRYIEFTVQTAGAPLTLERFVLKETRYPLEMESTLSLSSEDFMGAVPLMWRTLQMCSHETFMDCPFYEELMYTGDTRLETLVYYVTTHDDRLPRKALTLFASSLSASGLTRSRHPSAVPQIIPQFSLFWIAMLHDFALWRGDRAFVRKLMPTARCVMETFLTHLSSDDGLLRLPAGWDWVDWVPEWSDGKFRIGTPPTEADGLSAINNLQLLMTLKLMSGLEQWLGEPELAARLEKKAERLGKLIQEMFWDEPAALFADTTAHALYSEHAQCYAYLSGLVPPDHLERFAQALANRPDLARATVYFRHYLFDVFAGLGRTEEILKRMELWYGMRKMGLKTSLECPEPSRSDCHAWGAHPIYHAFASILGIRPAGLGSKRVHIRPCLGSLEAARCEMVYRGGKIRVDFSQKDGRLCGSVELPKGVEGELLLGHKPIPLQEGKIEII